MIANAQSHLMIIYNLLYMIISMQFKTLAVKCYQRRLGLDVKDNFVTGDAFVWRFLYKSSVKDIYSCLVKTSESLKCTEKMEQSPCC